MRKQKKLKSVGYTVPQPIAVVKKPTKESTMDTDKERGREKGEIPIEEEDNLETNPAEDKKEEKSRYKIERNYFLVKENEPKHVTKHIYEVDYMTHFKDWKICNETTLLNRMLLDYLEALRTYEDEGKFDRDRGKKQTKDRDRYVKQPEEKKFEDKGFTRSSIVTSKISEPIKSTANTADVDLKQWGRKDVSKEEEQAKLFLENLEKERQKDPLKNELTEFLNMMTVDNYDEIKQNILKKIRDNVEDQYKFLEVLFKKAVHEKAFVFLYAKLCKDLDKDLPQKSEKAQADKNAKVTTVPSKMRTRLLDICKEIFKSEGNTKLDQYVKVTDADEREAKLRKFLLGNVNFIGELINTQTLSKKIVFGCLNNLFARVEKPDTEKLLRQINLEAIVILLDKFGTMINKQDKKIKPEDLSDFNKRIDEYIKKLNEVKNDESLPGHIRYKVINLIEKRKAGWEESKFEKNVVAKSRDEVRQQYESDQQLNSTAIKSGPGGKKLDQEAVNSKIRDDLVAWKDHIKEQHAAEDYTWEIVDNLLRVNKNSLADILTAFGENCIDYVEKPEDLQLSYGYIREIIVFYSKKLNDRDRTEIVDACLYLLKYLNDISLDNNLLIDVWGGVVYLLEYYRIFNFFDLDKLTDLQEDQIKCIFDVINKALDYYENRDNKINDLLNIGLIKANKSTFLNTVQHS